MKTVGIWPAAAAGQRSAFFKALAQVMGVQFVPLDQLPDSSRSLCGLVVLWSPEDEQHRLARTELPTLVIHGDGENSHAGGIFFHDNPHVDPRLRGQMLSAQWSAERLAAQEAGWEVLATGGALPVWRRSLDRDHEHVSVHVPELRAGESLRDRFIPGRNGLGMIALTQFLRRTGGQIWSPPRLRATVIIDDPNVRWRSYGHLRFADVIRHAEIHDYHVSLAHIPLDFAVFDRRTVDLFRSASDRISLSIHGNNHARAELGAIASAAEADRILAQALQRTTRFEQRAGLAVSRIMVPPHEACSEAVMNEMPKLGFEAVSMTRAYGWLYGLDHSPYAAPDDIAAGFQLAEVTAFGMPVLIRRGLLEHEEILVRAFLDQPVILYGHEPDFVHGLGPLESAARMVNRFPGATWCDLSTLSRSNFLTRRVGDELHVKPFGRRIHVRLDPEVRSVVLEPLVLGKGMGDVEIQNLRAEAVRVEEDCRSRIVVAPHEGARELRIELVARARIDFETVPRLPLRMRHVVRRIGTEARDRLHPMRRRLHEHGRRP